VSPRACDVAAAAIFALALAARHLAQALITRHKRPGARSGWLSTALLFLCYVSAMCLALKNLAGGKTTLAAAAVGGGLWLLAVAFRMWALAHLGEFFSSLIEIRDGHRLVDTGPYALVRHPLHLAFGVEVAGMAVISWEALAVVPGVLVWAVLLARNASEEAALLSRFGADYEAYRARVPSVDLVSGLVRRLRRTNGA
jgi:protein-S-isoprenylcysteine O-methyltransferase Ste14